MNCALIGYGRAGKIHYKNILKNNNLVLKYVFDLNSKIKDIISKDNINYTDSIEEILYDQDIKIVVISTPTNTHYDFVKSCLQHKKHILCEKPLSENESEIIECYKLAEKNNLVLLCALNRRFDPKIIDLKNKISNNDIGNIHQIITISRDYPYPTYEYLKISNGIFHDCAVHDIDYVNWLLNDKPISVFVTGNIIKPKEVNDGNLDNVIITMHYSNNIIVTLNCSRISKNYDQRIQIFGEFGTLSMNNPYGNIENFKDEPISFPERYKESYINELQHLLDVINKKEKLKVKKDDCINCVRIVEACEKSFQKSTLISVKYSDGFRNYSNVVEAVRNNYLESRKNQTLEYVKNMHKKYLTFDKEMSINQIFSKLEKFVDISDPDISLPNYHHGIQTAEGIRADGHPDWLQLVGLIHDIGKIISLWGCDQDGTSLKKQWGIVGDTFIVGCKLPDKIIFPEFNNLNPDMENNKYNSKNGIYKNYCGLDSVYCSWGHDEYLYQILKNNKCNLPEEALYIIRFHSLYSYHKEGEYQHLVNQKDKKMFQWLKLFNKYDLYTKSDNIIVDEKIKEYYQKLINKYLNNGNLYF